MYTQLAQLSIRDLHLLLMARDIDPIHLVDACAAQIKTWESDVRAFVEYNLNQAMTDAYTLTETYSGDGFHHPLFGMPIGYKDLIDVVSYPTKAGGRAYGQTVAAANAHIVNRLTTCESITIGKLTTHEIAAGVISSPTSNPYDFTRIPGGSSGGSAAAVATGMVIGSVGTDTGGSGRIPAALCGVVGFKPTFGLIGRSGIVPRAISLDTVALLGKRVDDVRILFGASRGWDKHDKACLQYPPQSTLLNPTDNLKTRIRIGYPASWIDNWVSPDMRQAFEDTLHLLERFGCEVVSITPPSLEETLEVRRNIILPETAHHHGRLHTEDPALFGADVSAGIRAGKAIPAVEYLEALKLRERYALRFEALFKHIDFFVSPTTVVTAPLKDTRDIELPSGTLALIDALTLLTTPMNLARIPAVSIPITKDPTGLPIGLQICADVFHDDALLDFAQSLEEHFDFKSLLHPVRP